MCAIEKAVQLLKVEAVRSKPVRRHECATRECKRYGAKSSGGLTGRIRVDRDRGVYVHEADKESKNELEGRKWTGGSYSVGREWKRGRLWPLARIKSNSRCTTHGQLLYKNSLPTPGTKSIPQLMSLCKEPDGVV